MPARVDEIIKGNGEIGLRMRMGMGIGMRFGMCHLQEKPVTRSQKNTNNWDP